MTTLLVAPQTSRGIWLATSDLADALHSIGHDVDLRRVLRRSDRPAHAHLGNSTRRLLPPLAIRRGDLVTLHDVVPRQRGLHKLLTPLQTSVLGRHHVAVHSLHAAEMLKTAGFAGEVLLTPPLAPITPVALHRIHQLRDRWGCADYDLTLVSAGEVRKAKGTEELIEAARGHPSVLLVLVGRVADNQTAELLRSKPDNVVHTDAEALDDFCHKIAAADALVSLRRSSVGESSGPVVQAHRLRKPVLGLKSGSLPEHCGPGDILLDPEASAGDLFGAALVEPVEDLPATAPQIPDPKIVARSVLVLYRSCGLL